MATRQTDFVDLALGDVLYRSKLHIDVPEQVVGWHALVPSLSNRPIGADDAVFDIEWSPGIELPTHARLDGAAIIPMDHPHPVATVVLELIAAGPQSGHMHG